MKFLTKNKLLIIKNSISLLKVTFEVCCYAKGSFFSMIDFYLGKNSPFSSFMDGWYAKLQIKKHFQRFSYMFLSNDYLHGWPPQQKRNEIKMGSRFQKWESLIMLKNYFTESVKWTFAMKIELLYSFLLLIFSRINISKKHIEYKLNFFLNLCFKQD